MYFVWRTTFVATCFFSFFRFFPLGFVEVLSSPSFSLPLASRSLVSLFLSMKTISTLTLSSLATRVTRASGLREQSSAAAAVPATPPPTTTAAPPKGSDADDGQGATTLPPFFFAVAASRFVSSILESQERRSETIEPC